MAEPQITLPGEIWKPVVGHEGIYEISSFGRLKRLVGRYPERISQGFMSDTGYRRANLGRAKKDYIHRLVCRAFHGPAPEGKAQVAHYDGDKTNNRAGNLRWADHAENSGDGLRLGRVAHGEGHPYAVLSEQQVREIRSLHGIVSMREIGRRFGICHQHVGNIIHRRIWKHI